MDSQLEKLIGEKRFLQYLLGVRAGDDQLVHQYYKLDLECRGIFMKSVGFVEHRLISLVSLEGHSGQSPTFGDLRRTYKSMSATDRFNISRAFGVANQKELESLLASLNAFRNRAAHHDRIWNFRSKLAVPKRVIEPRLSELGKVKSPFSLAANLVGIDLLVPSETQILNLARDINNVIQKSHLDRDFIRESMGFEVP